MPPLIPGLSDEAIWNSRAVKAAQVYVATLKTLAQRTTRARYSNNGWGASGGEPCYVPRPDDEDIVPRAFAAEKEKRSKDQLLIERYGLTLDQISGLRLQMETYDHDAAFAEMHSDPRGQFFEEWAKTIREHRLRLADFAGTLGFTVNFAWEEPYLLDKDGNLVDVVYSRWPRGRSDDRLLVALVRAQS